MKVYFAALMALTLACASNGPTPTRVSEAIAGAWVNDRANEDRSGWRAVISGTLEGLEAPEPFELVIREDGSFSASYGAKDFRTLQRILRDPDLENPLHGNYSVAVDWSGAAWIHFEPGAPERRVTLKKGRLTLHRVGELWRHETYSVDTSADAG